MVTSRLVEVDRSGKVVADNPLASKAMGVSRR